MNLLGKRAPWVVLGVVVCLASMLGIGLSSVAPAGATTAVTLYVTTTGNDTGNDCTVEADPCATIQNAVNVAQAGAYNGYDVTIDVASGQYSQGFQIDASNLGSLAIVGAGASTTTVSAPSAVSDGSVSIEDLSMSNINAEATALSFSFSTPSSLTVIGDTFANDYFPGDDNASGDGGALAMQNFSESSIGAATIDNDTFVNDYAGEQGGAVESIDLASTTLANDTFMDDTTGPGQCINGADFGGYGSALYNTQYNGVTNGTTFVTNDTFVDDPAGFQGDGNPNDPCGLQETGAIINQGGNLIVSNSILQNAPCANYATAGQSDGGYNIETGPDTCGFGGTSDVLATSTVPGLATTLAVNGSGGPETLAVSPGSASTSPAFEEVPASACTVTTDQRGYPRPGIPGQSCDAGAYEVYQPTQGSPSSDSVTQGAAYSNQLTLTNPSTAAGPVTWTTTTPSPDVSLSSTGAVTAPATDPPGIYTVSGTMADAAGDAGTWSFSLTVMSPGTKVIITTTALPDGTVGQPYSFQLQATGGTLPYTWNKHEPVLIGALPHGLHLSPSGLLSGTPKKAGTYTIVVKCLDSVRPFKTKGSQRFTLTINP